MLAQPHVVVADILGPGDHFQRFRVKVFVGTAPLRRITKIDPEAKAQSRILRGGWHTSTSIECDALRECNALRKCSALREADALRAPVEARISHKCGKNTRSRSSIAQPRHQPPAGSAGSPSS